MLQNEYLMDDVGLTEISLEKMALQFINNKVPARNSIALPLFVLLDGRKNESRRALLRINTSYE